MRRTGVVVMMVLAVLVAATAPVQGSAVAGASGSGAAVDQPAVEQVADDAVDHSAEAPPEPPDESGIGAPSDGDGPLDVLDPVAEAEPDPTTTVPGVDEEPVAGDEPAIAAPEVEVLPLEAPRSPGTLIYDPRPGSLALTFDDGPHPVYTPQILDILDAYNARATFFVVGTEVQRYPHLVAAMRARGHSVQNHTMNHPDLTRLSDTGIRNELTAADNTIIAAGVPKPRCFRPPYAATNSRVTSIAAERGLVQRMWTVDPQDWTRPGAATIRARVASAGSGSIVILHDGGGDRSQTVAALPGILTDLAGRGLRSEALCLNWAEFGFFDVRPGHPFGPDIARLVQRGIATGYADNTYRPSNYVSRQAAAAFLWRRSGRPPAGPNAHEFPDVPPGHAFREPIRWINSVGVTNGYVDGKFAPSSAVTRQALAVWLWRRSGQPIYRSPPPFRDVPITHPFAEPIGWAAAAGLVRGYADGTFAPSVPVTRQAMASILTAADAIHVP